MLTECFDVVCAKATLKVLSRARHAMIKALDAKLRPRV